MSNIVEKDYEHGQPVWLLNGATVEAYFIGGVEKSVLTTTIEETRGTRYRMKGTATLYTDEASAIKASMDVLRQEIIDRQMLLESARDALEVAQRKSAGMEIEQPARSRHAVSECGPSL